MPKKTGQKIVTMDANRYYTIVSAQSKKAMEAGANDAIYMNDANGSESQQWGFVPVEDGYSIVSRHTGEVIDILLAGTEDGAQIHLYEDVGAENQKWIVEEAKKGTYKIFAKNSGKCLDVVGISGENGACIQIWEDLDGENQHWLIEDPTEEKKPAAKKYADKTAEPKASAKKPDAKAETTTVKKAASTTKTAAADKSAPVKAAAKTAAKTEKPAPKAANKKTVK